MSDYIDTSDGTWREIDPAEDESIACVFGADQ